MAEEFVQGSEDSSTQQKKNRFFSVLKRLVYILMIVVAVFLVIELFWKISNVVYNKKGTLEGQEPTQGTIDVYAKEVKTEPLSTFDTGVLKFEISSDDPLSSGVFVTVQIVLGYNSSTKAQKGKKDAPDALSEELKQRNPQFQDIIRNLLIRKTYQELVDHDGIVRIKKELLNRINRVLVNGEVADMYLAQWDVVPR